MIFRALAIVFALSGGPAWAGPLFGYTHLQPSPFTLPAGRFIYGTELAWGATDFVQLGTSLVRNIYKNYNANLKVSLFEIPEFALSAVVGFETFNYRDIVDTNPDQQVTSWLPGLVTSVEMAPNSLALIVGGNLNFTKTTLLADGITKSGYFRGAAAGADLSWAYGGSKRGKKTQGLGNVLSGGVSYDFSFKLFGIGLSHHWKGFRLGVHYFPNADRYPLQPLISGGGAVDL